jgi:hypothetical protein
MRQQMKAMPIGGWKIGRKKLAKECRKANEKFVAEGEGQNGKDEGEGGKEATLIGPGPNF